MSVTVRDDIMAVGSWDVDLDYTPVVKALLVDEDNYNRPRKLHALIYNAPVGGSLIYVGVLLKASGDDKGIHIGGVGPLWHLGAGDIGPMIADREYVSGKDKLDNGSFDLDDLYWRIASEGSNWVLASGLATNAGGLTVDDVLENDRKFPTRPGYSYQVAAAGVSGAGRLRVRTIYEGRFTPPNRMVNWLAADAVTIGPIPKPQLIAGWDFASNAGWTLGPTMSISGGRLVASPNPQPQYIDDPNFNNGPAGWTGVGPNIGNIEIVNEPAEGFGGWTMRAGPVNQHQVLTNAAFEDSDTTIPYWWESSDLAEPDDVFYLDGAGGLDGGNSATTDGAATADRDIKFLRASSTPSPPFLSYDVKPGEAYEVEAHIRAAPNTDGRAWITIHIPHPTVANQERWYSTPALDGPDVDDDVFRRVYFTLSIPPNRHKIDVLFVVSDHNTGYWAVDDYTVTRTRGNRARMEATTSYPVVADTEYRFNVDVRSGGDQQTGSVRVGVILKGAGLEDLEVADEKGSTDFEWNRVSVDVRPPTGYTSATPFVSALDIVGDPVWLDMFTFSKVSNNRDVSTHAPVTVIPDQRYLLAADVEVVGATRGTVTVGVTLSGAGVTDQDVSVSQTTSDGAGVKAISTEVRPGPGYTTATPYVRSTDIEGGNFHVYKATLTKMDNNTATSTATTLTVTPERTYRWSQTVRSGANLQRGTVTLSVTCTRSGYPNVVFDSAAMEATAGANKELVFEFTPPSGYDSIVPKIIGTDIEGDNWYVGSGQLRDTDSSTVVFDVVSDNPVNASPLVNSSAPDGAESVRVAVVVEAGTSSWTVNSVSLKRTGVTPATGAAIIADLLRDPETNLPLSIVAGTINAPAVIPYDWVIQNMTNRAALDHLCNVVYEGGLEYRVNPTNPPTIDVGPPGTVFDTHAPADALLPEDIDVEDLSNPEVDVESRATVVRVIGAERQTVSGRPFLVTADADVPGTVELDYNGRAIVRRKIISDGTVDHFGYAAAFATDEAAKEAQPALALSVKLSGKATRADSPPGDVIYAYEPEAGLEDEANPTTIEGVTTFPRAVKVLDRERALGPSHRIEMRRSDGTTFELPHKGVGWSDEDATVFTIGDRLADWQADPQAQAAGVQYLRDRASRPR